MGMSRRKTVPELRDYIIRLRKGQSIREIQRDTGTHRRIIRRIRNVAEGRGWLNPDAGIPSEKEIHDATRNNIQNVGHPLDEYRTDIERWVLEKKSFVVMHSLLRDRYSCDESTIRRYVKRNFSEVPKPVMVRNSIAGETMEVDYGYLGLTLDEDTGRIRKTYVFSGRLRYSRKAYREIVFDQRQETFFICHIHAFEHFGGVPKKVSPDNLKAAVIRASFDDPEFNRSYIALAEHYEFQISRCQPFKPNQKGGVENDIKYVKNNFLPVFIEHEKRLGHEIPRAADMIMALERWDEETADVRTIRGVGRSPLEIFEQEEVAALQPLPEERWEPILWKNCKVGRDFRIQFEKAFYSVPYRFIGCTVQVAGISSRIRIFSASELITEHDRATRQWQYVRKSEHAPPHQEEYLNLTRNGIMTQAEGIGPSVAKVIHAIFDVRAIDGLDPARGVLRLAKKYSPGRLEAACSRALSYDASPSYKIVKNILERNLDASLPTGHSIQLAFRFMREHGFFDPANHENQTGENQTTGENP